MTELPGHPHEIEQRAVLLKSTRRSTALSGRPIFRHKNASVLHLNRRLGAVAT
jgi:hypothetical protein